MDAMTPTLTRPDALSPADRCDRCGAQAYVRAVLADGELLFCAHHGRQYAARLREIAVSVQDESGVLEGFAPSEN